MTACSLDQRTVRSGAGGRPFSPIAAQGAVAVLVLHDQKVRQGLPSWAVLPDRSQRGAGVKRCGVVSIDVSLGLGTTVVEPAVEPAGMRQYTIDDDIADPSRA
jgi:hypothetical protein